MFWRSEAMRYRVLVIESEASLRNKLVSAFAGGGFSITAASDYSEALMQIGNFSPDMDIMESVLPDKDGFKACSELRSRFHIPVILVGQDRNDRVWERVMEAGADHYEVKPLRYLSLAARVRAILRRYSPTTSRN